jgi:hypothetical protein
MTEGITGRYRHPDSAATTPPAAADSFSARAGSDPGLVVLPAADPAAILVTPEDCTGRGSATAVVGGGKRLWCVAGQPARRPLTPVLRPCQDRCSLGRVIPGSVQRSLRGRVLLHS